MITKNGETKRREARVGDEGAEHKKASMALPDSTYNFAQISERQLRFQEQSSTTFTMENLLLKLARLLFKSKRNDYEISYFDVND